MLALAGIAAIFCRCRDDLAERVPRLDHHGFARTALAATSLETIHFGPEYCRRALSPEEGGEWGDGNERTGDEASSRRERSETADGRRNSDHGKGSASRREDILQGCGGHNRDRIHFALELEGDHAIRAPSLSPPTLRERRHPGLTRRFVSAGGVPAMRRGRRWRLRRPRGRRLRWPWRHHGATRSGLWPPVGGVRAGHPTSPGVLRYRSDLHDAAEYGALGAHVKSPDCAPRRAQHQEESEGSQTSRVA
jgi:hypothetical protein